MAEPENITWRELTGNKFNMGLHPSMLREQGYVRTRNIRKTGDTVKSTFVVLYDYKYVTEYIARNICQRLFSMGKEEVLALISKVWDETYPNATSKAVTLPKNS